MKYADGTTIVMVRQKLKGDRHLAALLGQHGEGQINRNAFCTNPAETAAAMPKDLSSSEAGPS